eukprot:gene18665-25182_t
MRTSALMAPVPRPHHRLLMLSSGTEGPLMCRAPIMLMRSAPAHAIRRDCQAPQSLLSFAQAHAHEALEAQAHMHARAHANPGPVQGPGSLLIALPHALMPYAPGHIRCSGLMRLNSWALRPDASGPHIRLSLMLQASWPIALIAQAPQSPCSAMLKAHAQSPDAMAHRSGAVLIAPAHAHCPDAQAHNLAIGS